MTLVVDGDDAAVVPDDDDELLGLEPRRGRRSGLWVAVVAAVVVCAFVVLLVSAKRPTDRSVLPGRPAPGVETSFQTLAGGSARLADLRGRYVVLNFFASWCLPCEQEHPELIRFQQRHAAAGDATVVQVLFNDRPEAARRFADERGDGGWPVLVDGSGRFALDYGVTAPPETFLIDRQGIVLAAVKGGIDEAKLEDLLTRAKQGPTP
jgi:cytochrome c biogenesis protein CcmG/thiol:disulfide interchange protein DsbE